MLFIDPVLISDGTSNGKRTTMNATDEVLSSWLVGTTYGLLAQVKHLHEIYESRVAGNVGNDPVTATDKWRALGPLNSWAMFDTTTETQTKNATSILFTLTLAQAVNSIAFLNCDAQTIRVKMTDPVAGIVFDETVSMTSTDGITDMWAWLFLPIDRRRDYVFMNLPLFSSAVIEVTINNPGSTAKCGVCTVGLLKSIGTSDYGTGFGIVDYSRIIEDEFGSRKVVLRGFAKRMSARITMLRNEVDGAARKLQDYRQINVVWIASTEYEATIIFGPYESFEVIITNWGMSTCNLTIKGLV